MSVEPGRSLRSPSPALPGPSLPPPHPAPRAPPQPSPASPLSVRLRKDSLRLRCRLKPPSSSALPGEPGIMLVWNQGRRQGPSTPPAPAALGTRLRSGVASAPGPRVRLGLERSGATGGEAAKGQPTHVSQVEGDLQAGPEVVGELGVHVQHLQQVVPMDLVQVAVGEGPHVPIGLARPRV